MPVLFPSMVMRKWDKIIEIKYDLPCSVNVEFSDILSRDLSKFRAYISERIEKLVSTVIILEALRKEKIIMTLGIKQLRLSDIWQKCHAIVLLQYLYFNLVPSYMYKLKDPEPVLLFSPRVIPVPLTWVLEFAVKECISDNKKIFIISKNDLDEIISKLELNLNKEFSKYIDDQLKIAYKYGINNDKSEILKLLRKII